MDPEDWSSYEPRTLLTSRTGFWQGTTRAQKRPMSILPAGCTQCARDGLLAVVHGRFPCDWYHAPEDLAPTLSSGERFFKTDLWQKKWSIPWVARFAAHLSAKLSVARERRSLKMVFMYTLVGKKNKDRCRCQRSPTCGGERGVATALRTRVK